MVSWKSLKLQYEPIKKRLGAFEPYVVAVLAVFLIFSIKLFTPHNILHEIPFLNFFLAVLVSGIYGGFSAGVCATIVAALLSDYFFLPPVGHLLKDHWHQHLKLALFVADCLVISGLCGFLRGALARTRLLEKSESDSRRHLQVSNERLKLALESAQMGTWHVDLKTSFMTVSESAAFIHQTAAMSGDVLSVMKQFVHPEDLPGVIAEWQRCVDQRIPYSQEYRILREDGSVSWLLTRGTTLMTATGDPDFFSGVFADITERKKAEARLALEQHKLESIFRESPAAMAFWRGRDLIFEMANPEYQKIFKDRELLGRPLFEAVPELRGQGFEELLLGVFETGTPVHGREVLARVRPAKDGPLEERYYDFSYVQVRDFEGRPYGVYDHAIDVTEKVLSRRRLEESDERLRLALQGGQMGTWSLTYPERSLLSDERFLEIHQVSPGDSAPESILKRIHREDLKQVKTQLVQSLKNAAPYNCEYRVNNVDGSYTWVYARGEPKYDAQKRAVSLSGVAFDISERKRVQEELEVAKAEAERANQAKSAFLANMSHEIRTPLGAIMGFVSLLKESGLSAEEVKNYISIIDRNSKHLLRLVDDVLDLSKVEAGKISLEKMEFSLKELLLDFCSIMSLKARENSIHFDFVVETAMPECVCSDPTRIRQILNNVVGNAIKFTEQGEVRLRVSYQDTFVHLRVEDTGHGISSDQRSKLFQAFSQADTSTTRKFGGTGLGLVLTKKLSQALGGDFDLIQSELGKGSIFEAHIRVDLPTDVRFLPAPQFCTRETAATSAVKLSGDFKDLKVLLVEDSPDNQVLFQLYLHQMGAQVSIASDGFEGVEKGLNNFYHIILMDIQMPNMDGHEAVRTLRAGGYHGPIVALTAHAMNEERERAEVSGFSHFLSKPIHRKHLHDLLLQLKLDLSSKSNQDLDRSL